LLDPPNRVELVVSLPEPIAENGLPPAGIDGGGVAAGFDLRIGGKVLPLPAGFTPELVAPSLNRLGD
jgi:hypothetical protein